MGGGPLGAPHGKGERFMAEVFQDFTLEELGRAFNRVKDAGD